MSNDQDRCLWPLGECSQAARIRELEAEIAALEAERDKLRVALKDTINHILVMYDWSDQVGLYDIEEEPAVVNARAALAETEGE